MNTPMLILLHLKVFAAIAVAMYALVITRNAVVLCGPSIIKGTRHRLDSIRRVTGSKHDTQLAVESVRMPGRTRPANNFYSLVHHT